MAFYDKFPYTNFQEINLDKLIIKMLQLELEQKDFINNNVIKYADPISWNITTQYEANTVVTDSLGNAYISSKPVPAGVNITNTDYWSKIGNFDALWTSIKDAITSTDIGTGSTTPDALSEGALLWQADVLYKTLAALPAGTAIVPGTNVEAVTVEELLNDLDALIQNNASAITNLHTDIDNLQDEIDNLVIATTGDPVNVLTLGVKNDGSEDASAIINQYTQQYDLYFPAGTYLIDNPITPVHSLIGAGNVRVEEGLTILKAHFNSVNKGVIDFTDVTDFRAIVIRDMCIDCSYFQGYGINYMPSDRKLTEVRNVTILDNKNWGINVAPIYNHSRPFYGRNISIKGDGNNGGMGIYLSANAGDCELSDLEILYVDHAIDNEAYMLRLHNAHLYGGRYITEASQVDTHWPATIGVNTSGMIIGDGIYIDSFFQGWVQRGMNSIVGNMVIWYDSWMNGAARRDGQGIRTTGNGNMAVTNLVAHYNEYVQNIFTNTVQVKSFTFYGLGSINNITSHNRPLMYAGTTEQAYPNMDAQGNFYVRVAAIYVGSVNSGSCKAKVIGGNEVFEVECKTGTANVGTVTVNRINGFRNMYWKKEADGVIGLYVQYLNGGYGCANIIDYGTEQCAFLNVLGSINLPAAYQADASGLTPFTFGTPVNITVY